MVRKRYTAKASESHALASAINPERMSDMAAAPLKQQPAMPGLSKLAHVGQDPQHAALVQK